MALSPQTKRQKADEQQEMRVGWKMAGVGFQVASEVAAGALLGLLFDFWKGTGRIGLLVGSLVGIAVALWSLVRQSLKLNRELDRVAPTKGRGNPLPPDPDPDSEDSWNDKN